MLRVFNHNSHTFEKVSVENDIHWKCQYYTIVKEYNNRPSLPPPLNIFALIYQCGRSLLSMRDCCERKSPIVGKYLKLTTIFRENLVQESDSIQSGSPSKTWRRRKSWICLANYDTILRLRDSIKLPYSNS